MVPLNPLSFHLSYPYGTNIIVILLSCISLLQEFYFTRILYSLVLYAYYLPFLKGFYSLYLSSLSSSLFPFLYSFIYFLPLQQVFPVLLLLQLLDTSLYFPLFVQGISLSLFPHVFGLPFFIVLIYCLPFYSGISLFSSFIQFVSWVYQFVLMESLLVYQLPVIHLLF